MLNSATMLTVLSQGATGTQACSPLLHAHVIREDDAPERQSKSTVQSAATGHSQEHVTLCAIRSETRSPKWERGSRSQTHRRAAKGGFTQDDGKVERRLASPPTALFVPSLF